MDRLVSTASSQVEEEAFKGVREWLDKIQFTRQRKHLHRDFSDGVLMAELISHFFPKMIELHNYVGANGWTQKKNNWDLLNRKVLSRLGIKLQDAAIDNICLAKPGYIEPVLGQVKRLLKKKSIEEERAKTQHLVGNSGDSAEISLVEETCLIHIVPNELPDFVIYRGRKYCPETLLDEQNQSNAELKEKIKELTSKARRMETLVNLKENHLEDLTKQLHKIRIKIGEVSPQECMCELTEGEKPQRPQTTNRPTNYF